MLAAQHMMSLEHVELLNLPCLQQLRSRRPCHILSSRWHVALDHSQRSHLVPMPLVKSVREAAPARPQAVQRDVRERLLAIEGADRTVHLPSHMKLCCDNPGHRACTWLMPTPGSVLVQRLFAALLMHTSG